MLAFLNFLQSFVLGIAWDFDIDPVAIGVEAQAILTQFMPYVLILMGVSLGFRVYNKAKRGGA